MRLHTYELLLCKLLSFVRFCVTVLFVTCNEHVSKKNMCKPSDLLRFYFLGDGFIKICCLLYVSYGLYGITIVCLLCYTVCLKKYKRTIIMCYVHI